jgi:hypothetical protein
MTLMGNVEEFGSEDDSEDDLADEEGYGGISYLREKDLTTSTLPDLNWDTTCATIQYPEATRFRGDFKGYFWNEQFGYLDNLSLNSLLFEHRSPKSLADESRLAIITANIMLSNEKEGLSFQQLLHEQHLASSTAAVTTPSSFSTSPSEKTTLSENEPLKLGLTYLQPDVQPGGQPGVHQKANLKLTSPHHRGPPGGGGVHHQSSFAACVKVDSPHRDVHANSPRPKLRGGSRRSGNSSSCVGCSYISSLHRLL